MKSNEHLLETKHLFFETCDVVDAVHLLIRICNKLSIMLLADWTKLFDSSIVRFYFLKTTHKSNSSCTCTPKYRPRQVKFTQFTSTLSHTINKFINQVLSMFQSFFNTHWLFTIKNGNNFQNISSDAVTVTVCLLKLFLNFDFSQNPLSACFQIIFDIFGDIFICKRQ